MWHLTLNLIYFGALAVSRLCSVIDVIYCVSLMYSVHFPEMLFSLLIVLEANLLICAWIGGEDNWDETIILLLIVFILRFLKQFIDFTKDLIKHKQ